MYKSQYKYPLDPGSKKFYCPNCLQKTFVKFFLIETGNYLDDKYGRCDREEKCGYFHIPENNYSVRQSINYPVINSKRPEKSLIPLEFVDKYFNPEREHENHFIEFLHSKFKKHEVNKIIKDYFLSTCIYWGQGATIFWQIDENYNVRSGQVILYDSVTGKRIKEPFNHITWAHTILKKEGNIRNFNLEQTLFGMHLSTWQPEKKMIAIVEAPKTACIMSVIYPDYQWMATCGLSNLKLEKLKPIKSKKIVLYPDLGSYHKWKSKAITLKKEGYKIEVSALLETNYPRYPTGSDIADLFIDKL